MKNDLRVGLMLQSWVEADIINKIQPSITTQVITLLWKKALR